MNATCSNGIYTLFIHWCEDHVIFHECTQLSQIRTRARLFAVAWFGKAGKDADRLAKSLTKIEGN